MNNLFKKFITYYINRKSNNELKSQIFFNLPTNNKNVLNEKWILEKSWINLLTVQRIWKDWNTINYKFVLSSGLILKEQQNKIIEFNNKQNSLYHYTLLKKIAALKNIQTPTYNSMVQYKFE